MSGSSTSSQEDVIDEGEEKFHPFIQAELETLNMASHDVNSLEARLEECRIAFIEINKERTVRLDENTKKIGKCIEKARPYYEAKSKQKAIQIEVQRAAQVYERACNTVDAAKEMVQLAEQSVQSLGTLDRNWQEVLNHATERVLKAEREKEDSERTHRIHAENLSRVAQYCMSVERSVKSCIAKSSAYFDLLQSYNEKLEEKKKDIKELESNLHSAKQSYSLALSTLENISNIIHERRQVLRQKRHQKNDSDIECEEKGDPLLLDVPDLIRQLSVSSTSHANSDTPPFRTNQPSESSLSSGITPDAPHLFTKSTIIHSTQSTTDITKTTPDSKTKVKTSSKGITIRQSSRPMQIKPSNTIRAGVVMNPLDLLRSVGLDHLAQSPSSKSKKTQNHETNPQPKSLLTAKGLTSSRSSFSIPSNTKTKEGSSPSSKSTRSIRQQLAKKSAAPPSPSPSEASTTSSSAGGVNRKAALYISHDHSRQSSENEDSTGMTSDASTLKAVNEDVSTTMSVTPVSLDAQVEQASAS